MKIWRVEDEYGQGCYYAHLPYNFIDNHTRENGHPRPEDDRGIKRGQKEEEICGFVSKEQAKKWFTQYELRCMREEGFDLKEIEVEKITAIGHTQVLAIRGKENTPESRFMVFNAQHLTTC